MSGGAGVQDHAGASAQLADLGEVAVQVRARLDVNPNGRCSRFDEVLDVELRALDHEVDVEGQAGMSVEGRDDVRAKGEVGHDRDLQTRPILRQSMNMYMFLIRVLVADCNNMSN